MAIDFPGSPSVNDTFTSGSLVYTFDGTKWTAEPAGVTGGTKIEVSNTKAEIIDTGTDGRFVVTTEGSERLRVTSAGLMGLGTASPGELLHVYNSAATSRLIVGPNGTGAATPNALALEQDNTGFTVCHVRNLYDNGGLGELRLGGYGFTTFTSGSSQTERARIDSSGRLLVGTTTLVSGILSAFGVLGSGAAATFQGGGAAGQQTVYIHHTATSGNNLFLEFGTEASINTRGSVDYNRSAGQVRYNVTSDRRLKSNIEDASSALSVLDQIKVRSYTWTETGYNISYGFIAQELNEAVPDAVKVGDDGDEVVDTWAVDNAKLVPLLTKALQEMIAELQTLKAEVAALKAS